MRLLIDTNALLWWLAGSNSLTNRARTAILDSRNDVFVSAISFYEIALKHAIGKLSLTGMPADICEACDAAGFLALPVRREHALAAGALSLVHKEPWDRLIAAQAISEGLNVVSNDQGFDRLGATRFW